MSTQHLGERLSALVDGELGAAEHDSALIHLAKCESCRFEADMLRRLKRRLHGLGEPEPDLDFMGRLTELSHDQESARDGRPDPPFGGGGMFGAGPPLGSSRPIGGLPTEKPLATEVITGSGSAPTTEPVEESRAHRSNGRGRGERWTHLLPPFPGGRYAVAGIAMATALLGSAFVAGGDTEDTPVVEPRLSDYAVEHAVTSRHLPVTKTMPIDHSGRTDPGTAESSR